MYTWYDILLCYTSVHKHYWKFTLILFSSFIRSYHLSTCLLLYILLFLLRNVETLLQHPRQHQLFLHIHTQ